MKGTGKVQLPEQKRRKVALTRKLFEDSLVKVLEPSLRKFGTSEVQVTLIPGRGNRKIKIAIERASVAK